MKPVRCLILVGCVLVGLCRQLTAEEPPLVLPVVGIGESATEHIASVYANPRQHKLYVGVLSRDATRTGLHVYDLGTDGQPVGKPRKYSDHPDELPAGHHSTVVCLLHDARQQRLYFGVQGSHPTHARSLVMYALDAKGEPTGSPEAFDHGNPNKSCDGLSLHPTNNRLYAVGWGGEGVFILDLDGQGRPVGKPLFQRTGGYGAHVVAIRSDGSKLYRGTYPATLEVCNLDQAGNIVGPPISQAIPDGAKEYLHFVATDRGLYFRGPDRRLAWYKLNAKGDIDGTLQSADIPGLQAVAAAIQPDRLLVAAATGFTDAISGKAVINGAEVREVALKADGTFGAVTRQTKPYSRAEAVTLSNGEGAALAVKSQGRGFLGNRLAGLKVRCSIVSLEQDGPPFPAVTTVKFGDEQTYLRFVVSQKHGRVYAAANERVVSHQLTGKDQTATVEVPCPEATGPMAIDEQRGVLFVALKSGAIAVRKLDERGVPAAEGDVFKTTIQPIGVLLVHPATGTVYAIGQSTGQKLETPGVVSIPAGLYSNDAALDATRGRLYVAGAYHGRENTSVWKLDVTGQLAAPEPTWLADGIPATKPSIRDRLATIKLDVARRKLYIAGEQEDPPEGPAYVIVRDLNDQGDGIGEPRLYPSQAGRGSCWSLALTDDGQWLYESGWGDQRICQRRLDEQGEPSRDSVPWTVGGHGKRQLTLATYANQRYLLAGTHPSLLEVIPMRTASEPEAGAQAELTVETLRQPLGLLSAGRTSEWVGLDSALQNGVGQAVVRCTLQGARVKRAVLRWEVARQNGDKLDPIRTVDLTLVGNVGALILPKYGIDDAALVPSLVRTSAEEYQRYLQLAKKYAISSTEQPKKLLVANGLIGLDSSEEALEAGMATLELLGHNAAQIWSWPGVAAETIRAAADRHGIRRFRDAVYNPPSYFHYNTELVRPESLDKWAAGFRDAAAKMGAKPEELELLHMGDEPGWYFPQVTKDVQDDPKRLAVFREYLKSKGLTPADLGESSWEKVIPGNPSMAKSLPQKRLFYWTTRFYAESLSIAFAAATQSLQRQVNPKILTTTNLNNWPGRFYIPSPGQKYANNVDDSPNAAMGMPDWFDLGRKKAVSCIWTEDWFGDSDAQLWSMYGDQLRCAAREGNIEYGGYPVGQSTGAFATGATYKIAALIGHGAKTIDPYIFGPNLAFADGWSEKEVTYRNLAAAMRLIGKSERLVAPGRPRDGTVAIVFPQSSQVWDGESASHAYLQELYGLHAALLHENYPVDFIDDFGLEAGDLTRRKYSAIYVTAPNLSLKAQRALLSWVAAGGTLALSPGACGADEYNEPTTELRAHLKTHQEPVPRIAPPHHTQAFRAERLPITVTDKGLGTSKAFAITQTVGLRPDDPAAKTLATFANHSGAVVSTAHGKGQLLAFGFWPGVTYWLSPDRTDLGRLPSDWSAEARLMATYAARRANTARHVVVSEPGVEACLLESPAGIAVTLLNWTGRPISQLTVSIPGAGTVSAAASVEKGVLTRSADKGSLQITLPLDSVDVLLLDR
ncbi:MAG: hypothetical protein JWN70_4929 [Planctomycetaceae bacterium]|nr:hypothetical protein [Planctomycetaceae bacterium]